MDIAWHAQSGVVILRMLLPVISSRLRDTARTVPYLVSAVGLAYLTFFANAAEPVFKLAGEVAGRTNLVENGDFQELRDGKPLAWRAARNGFALDSGREAITSGGILCVNSNANHWTGVAQTIELNRSSAAPIVVRGWSKSENVSGSSDNDYSIYVDLTYADGTPLWGQTARFRAGTHDWERREVVILPEKPVRSLTVHCLFRNHTGKVWFDDISVQELAQAGGTYTFDTAPVVPIAGAAVQPAQTVKTLSTADGLAIELAAGRVTQVNLGGKALPGNSAFSGFLIRDLAKGSDVLRFDSNHLAEVGVSLETTWREQSDHLIVQGRLTDTSMQDRAVSLSFCLPVDANGWKWADDIRRERSIEGRGDFANSVAVGCGATGTMAQYPIAAIYNENSGLAIALDMGFPAQYRLGYNAGLQQLYITYDFGLVPETKPPGAAEFRFVLYHFDPRWGFRAAFDKMMRIFPSYFEVRSKEQGIWMPFTDVSTVQGWQDFGFKYHEGNNNLKWDDANGILSFRYTEPMTWWMRMPKEVPRTNPDALHLRDEIARDGQREQGKMARVSQSATMLDERGQPYLSFRNEPWCDGAVWSLNPNPHLNVGRTGDSHAFNAATVYWNPSLRETMYGSSRKADQDGEYLDSLEGYVTADLNFRREHFADSTVPLSFDKDTKHPALFKGLAVYEFTRWLSEDVHRLGKLMFANSVPYRYSFLCPWLDVMGTETDWVRQGKYAPVSDRQMNLWRTMCGKKPYLLLMNTDYDTFTPEMVVRYFQRSLFFGFFPSMFSHNASENPYWQNPKWYNRDRPLFKKYLPIIRQVAEAGWEPVTLAHSENDKVQVERFGSGGTVYFTLFNDSVSEQRISLTIEREELGLKADAPADELLTGHKIAGPLELTLEPHSVCVLRFVK